MATQYTGWGCTHSTEIIAENNTSITIRVHCYWQNSGWRYNISNVYAYVYCGNQSATVLNNGAVNSSNIANTAALHIGYADFSFSKTHSTQSISCYATIDSNSSYAGNYTRSSSASSVSVAARPTHTITYNANGGTGAPAAQTKWYSEDITLSTTKPTRTGHNFKIWNTNTAGTGTSYSPGATYSSNANLVLYALWTAHTYTVSYNANGGSGAPAAQTKTYGVNLTLSSTKPTRTNYNFKGWATSASGSVVYAAGGTYTNNAAVTLYAVWELAYVKPRITNFTANRCTSDGTVSETGTYIKVTFNWATDKTVTGINVQYKLQTASSWGGGALTYSGTTSGTVTQAVGQGNISTESSYHVRVYVTDSGGTTYSATLSIGTVKFPIDVKSGGTGVAIGKVAENANEFDVGWNARFRGTASVAGNTSIGGNLLLSGMFARNGHTCRRFLYILDATNASGRYYKLVSIPATSDGNAITVNIKGILGNWTDNKATIDLQISNRNSLKVYGSYIGDSGAFGYQRIVIYKESSGSHTVYLYNVNSYTGPNVLDITCGGYGSITASIVTDYSYTTAPTGTLAHSSTANTFTSLLDPYPVGSIYINWSRAKTPAELFGGTWVQMTGGFLYGSVNTSTSSTGSTGNGTGTSTAATAITEAQMPSHRHKGLLWGGVEVITLNEGSGAGYNLKYGGGNNNQNDAVQTALTGSGQGHTHGVPYIAVMIWRRTA